MHSGHEWAGMISMEYLFQTESFRKANGDARRGLPYDSMSLTRHFV